ncbi:uncharacterized protein LOC132047455 [Lycium ferocissimum]|uniref:uncharacterized protein LOC132047455 n=1 Tax=Lycium ferocissimum TaxID=112874 RepID=UPI0028169A38|nr:uncharacterized protein LOC132047455 [Lycium ferocissimum]
MEMLPTEEEVKEAVFSLNGESACGPDGFTGLFFQSCWEIVKLDVVDMVKAFFVGQELPRFITHTNLILIPKKEQVQSFSDSETNRSQSNFYQQDHLKGKEYYGECITHTGDCQRYKQENQNNKCGGKLDMTKAYDRVSWLFLTKVLRKFGFSESSRGVKQGDPLSPHLFILAAEASSRGLNALYKKPRFVEYGVPKWSSRINHLSYDDDTILFVSADQYSVKLMMRVLNRYEKVSGQLVNWNKSAFYVHEKVQSGLVSRLKQTTGIRQGLFPFTYLGCLIFYSRNKISHYDTVVKKIAQKGECMARETTVIWRKSNTNISWT